MELSADGAAWCARVGIYVGALGARRRRPCRACLERSERRTHLAGGRGRAPLDRMLSLGYARREPHSRAVTLFPAAPGFIEHLDAGV